MSGLVRSLGLSAVAGTVEQFSAFLWHLSRPTQGSRFDSRAMASAAYEHAAALSSAEAARVLALVVAREAPGDHPASAPRCPRCGEGLDHPPFCGCRHCVYGGRHG